MSEQVIANYHNAEGEGVVDVLPKVRRGQGTDLFLSGATTANADVRPRFCSCE